MRTTGLSGRIRSWDFFGASIGINYKGKASYQTLGGGLITLILKVTMLGFLIKSTIDVMSYKNPQLSSYEIMETRVGVSPFNMEEYKVRFVFGFVNDTTWKPIAPDPKYGSFLI